MKKIYFIPLVLILFCLLLGCQEKISEYEPLDPIKDDKTTVADFRYSKFDGLWQVTNLELDWDNPPVFDYQPLIYIFKSNTVQSLGGTRDWANEGALSDLNTNCRPNQFMYSDAAIYTYESRNGMTWIKRGYALSADGNKLEYGRDKLIKMDVQPWTKEDLLGSWYIGDPEKSFTTYTFTKDPLYDFCYFVIQPYLKKGLPLKDIYFDDYSISTKVELTDESFSGLLNFTGLPFVTPNVYETCYYYIINDKLYLSNSFSGDGSHCDILTRYIDLEE
ncbi:hypothetical protein R84B8_03270 [Treponema sp. R8-4-B8]